MGIPLGRQDFHEVEALYMNNCVEFDYVAPAEVRAPQAACAVARVGRRRSTSKRTSVRRVACGTTRDARGGRTS